MKPWPLLLLLLALTVSSPARAQDSCAEEDRRVLSLVYEVWQTEPLERRGLATLVDKRGVLVTAAHVIETALVPGKEVDHFLKLPNSNKRFEFTVYRLPEASTHNADWALLMAPEIGDLDDRSPGTAYTFSAHDLANASVLIPPEKSTVLSTSDYLLTGVEQTEVLQCPRPTGYLLHTSRYAHGDSGAAVVACGDVAAVVGRFEITFNDQTILDDLHKELNGVATWLRSALPQAIGDDFTKRYQYQLAMMEQGDVAAHISDIERLFDDVDTVMATPFFCVASSVAELYLDLNNDPFPNLQQSERLTDLIQASGNEEEQEFLLGRLLDADISWLELIELLRLNEELSRGGAGDERLRLAIANRLEAISVRNELGSLYARIQRYLSEAGNYAPPAGQGSLVDSLVSALATAESLHEVRKALLNQDLVLPTIEQSSAPIDVARRILFRKSYIPVDEADRLRFIGELDNSIALLLVGVRDGFNKGASLDAPLYNNALIDLAQMIQLRRRLIAGEKVAYVHQLAELRITQYLLSRDAVATVGWGTAFVTAEDMDNEVLTWLLRSAEKVSACPNEICGAKARTAIENNSPVYLELSKEVRAICRNRLELALPQSWEALAATLHMPDLKRYYLRLRDAERNGSLQLEINNVLSQMASGGPILLAYPCAPIAIRLDLNAPELPSGPTQLADWMAIAGMAAPTGIPFPLPPLTRTGQARVVEPSSLLSP